jgi:ribosome-binding protein aMBF1 (putative translation factor)
MPSISPLQSRVGRALVGWSRDLLAERALLSPASVDRFERGVADARTSTVNQIERALSAAGVEFVAGDGEYLETARLRRVSPSR